jgi:uncharacterized protein (DUF58 family)
VQLYPTRSTFHVAVAGGGLVALGVAERLAPVAAFGGAMLLAIAVGRAIATLAVTRLRAAGFEMVWTGKTRMHSVTLGTPVVLEGELRNRGASPVRAVGLRAIASSFLEVAVEPAAVDLAPGGRARVAVTVEPRRVGRWGLHGLALEVRGTSLGGEALYEVPLLFANPLGVEVLPRTHAAMLGSARGGRARRAAEFGRAFNVPGDGGELLELRDHAPGDAFKRIAWKASARRGRLLVREMAREGRDVVWLVVDASVELWAGQPGHAPLDAVVEEVNAVAARHLRRGERVGLVVTASRVRTWIPPAAGPTQAANVARALASAASAVDADRSELDEAAVASRVAEHARPLDPRGLTDLRKGDYDALARRADDLRAHAPFASRVPFAPTPREQSLRHYLAAFGIESPPRAEGEHERTELALAAALEQLVATKPRASVIHVWAPAPSRGETMTRAVARALAARIRVRWTLPPFEAGVGGEGSRRSPVAHAVDEAVRLRAGAARRRGERLLRRLGVQVVAQRRARAAAELASVQEKAPSEARR